MDTGHNYKNTHISLKTFHLVKKNLLSAQTDGFSVIYRSQRYYCVTLSLYHLAKWHVIYSLTFYILI
jgi:hypothetical protein